MRRFICMFIFLNIALIFTGCKSDKARPILYKENSSKLEDIADGEDINFSIDKISFSKSFQNIKPEVQVVKKGLNTKLLLSLGLINSSGIEIEKINKNGNDINIYVSNESDFTTNQLVVPQALIDIDEDNISNLEDFKYHIHNNNYYPISLKLDANDATNIINSKYQISTSTLPTIEIEKSRRRYYWSLEYFNIFDKSFEDSPVINLSVKIDAETGEIIEEKQEPISSFIDNGLVLDFLANKYILYKKTDIASKDDTTESVWLYNTLNQEKEKLFTSDDRIVSASFNTSYDAIALLESRDKNNQVYIIPLNDGKAYKMDLENPINPSIVKWKDNDNLFLVHKNKNSTLVSSYNVKNGELDLLAQSEKTILDLNIYKGYFLTLEEDPENQLQTVCLSRDLEESLYRDVGLQPRFINDKQIAYIKNNPSNDSNNLYIYDIEEKKLLDPIHYNLYSFTVLSNNNLALVEKNDSNSSYTLHEYDLKDSSVSPVTSISSDKISFNMFDNLLYVNSTLPFKESETQIIYTINIPDLSNSQP